MALMAYLQALENMSSWNRGQIYLLLNKRQIYPLFIFD